MEQKPNSYVNQGSLICCKSAKTIIYNTNLYLANDNEYTKFGLILSIRSEDIEQKPNSDIYQGP